MSENKDSNISRLLEELQKIKKLMEDPALSQEVMRDFNKAKDFVMEWCCQDQESHSKLPHEMRGVLSMSNYAILGNMTKQLTTQEAIELVNICVEAAFNFGKSQPKE